MSRKTFRGHFDVIIAGLGPTGATLANLLGLCGVSVLALDRFRAPYPLPRAVHFDDEVMRVFQTIGVAGEVGGIVRVNVGMRFIDPAGNLLLDWPRPQEIGPQGWHASYRFHQPDLERILRAALDSRATVRIGTGTEVVGVSDRGDEVEITCLDRETGNRSTVTAAYAVGCDGANSVVRKAMDVTEADLGFNERWLVADLLLKTPKPELGDHTVQYCDSRRPATYARGPGNRRRWEIAVLDGENADSICKPDNVWRLLKRWISPEEAEMERAAVYTFQSIVADQWRSGRLLIAGDAAHRTPPFMGQGMCAGIRDAANLAWKLALAIKGRAPQAILDSYGSERRPSWGRACVPAFAMRRTLPGNWRSSSREERRRRSSTAMAANAARMPAHMSKRRCGSAGWSTPARRKRALTRRSGIPTEPCA